MIKQHRDDNQEFLKEIQLSYTCSICLWSGKCLRRHFQTCHRGHNKPDKCHLCKYETFCKYFLECHYIRKHSAIKLKTNAFGDSIQASKLCCDFCGFNTASYQSLDIHNKLHHPDMERVKVFIETKLDPEEIEMASSPPETKMEI